MSGDEQDRTRTGAVDPLVGSVVDRRYRVEFRLAAGGFGAIYRAIHVITGRPVALKILHASLATEPDVVARFKREAATLAQLRDPHTVTAYDFGETSDGVMYIAMELLQGESLYERYCALGPLAWPRIVRIARQVCSSLAEAHAMGIVHRDLKPTNIHLEDIGGDPDFVKVLDFGIAKILHGSKLDSSDLTRTGQMVGTFDYMAPEQMVGAPTTGQSDIYTLGIVMYEMLAGERPFGDPATPAAMLTAMLSINPPPPSSFVIAPSSLDAVIARCLEREPGARYATIEDLAAELDAILAEEDATNAATRRPVEASRVDLEETDDGAGGIDDGMDDATEVTFVPPEVAEGGGDDRTWISSPPAIPRPASTLPGFSPPKKR